MIKNNRSAFTLAEMMIVMLILTILLAAFAPLMTKKAKVDLSNPWRWANNNSDIYYGIGANQTAMIGQSTKTNTDPNAKLLINQSDIDRPYISFKSGSDDAGGIFIDPTRGSLWMRANVGVDSEDLDGDTSFGINAMANGNSYFGSTAFGYEAMRYSNGARNTAVGTHALVGQDSNNNIEAGDNTAIGFSALRSNQVGHYTNEVAPGSNNTAVGSQTLAKNTTGHDNTAVGYSALFSNTTAHLNTAVGSYALQYTTSGEWNIAVGYNALNSNTTGSGNTGIGYEVLYANKSKSGNTGVGSHALYNTTGEYNTAIGSGALYGLKSGSNNTAIGKNACHLAETGSNNICIGNGTALPSNSTSNTVVIGNNSITAVRMKVEPTITSDKRLKNVLNESTIGLEKIKQIKVYNFTFKDDKEKTPRVGVMAQELQKIFPNSVSKGQGGYLGVNRDEMFFGMLNAIKELDKMLQDLIAQVKTVVAQVNAHDTQIKALQKENKELKNKVQNLEKQNKSFEARLKAIEKKL